MLARIKNFEFEVEDEPADYWQWIREGRYDREWEAYDRLLFPGHTFIDLGAWVGAHSLYASKKTTKIISVEPDPVAYPILEKNLKHGCNTRNLAITNYEGQVVLGSSCLGWSTTRANPARGGSIEEWHDDQTCVIPCTTLREFCRNIPDPLFIKIDVEGSEESILQDIEFFRERKPTVLLELHPFWWENEERVRRDLADVTSVCSIHLL